MNALLAIVLPVFGVMLTGYLAARLAFFTADHTKALSLYVFNFAIPVLLIRSLTSADYATNISFEYLIAYYAPALTVMALSYTAARALMAKPHRHAVVLAFGSTYGNSVLLGIPIVLLAFGEAATLPLFMMISVHGLLLFTITSIALELGHDGQQSVAQILLSAVKGLSTNPIFLGLLVGITLNALGVTLPETVDEWASLLGQSAVPCALFAMGASLAGYQIAQQMTGALLATGFKLLTLPIAVYVTGRFVFDLEPLWLNTGVLLASLPTGVNVYLFASKYDADTGNAATTVMLSTFLSLATITVVLNVLPPV